MFLDKVKKKLHIISPSNSDNTEKQRIDIIEQKVNQLERIIQWSKPGEITYHINESFVIWPSVLYVYKDMHEYAITCIPIKGLISVEPAPVKCSEDVVAIKEVYDMFCEQYTDMYLVNLKTDTAVKILTEAGYEEEVVNGD